MLHIWSLSQSALCTAHKHDEHHILSLSLPLFTRELYQTKGSWHNEHMTDVNNEDAGQVAKGLWMIAKKKNGRNDPVDVVMEL
jgi:hypothetical protein